MGLAGADKSGDDDVFGRPDERASGQFRDLLAADSGERLPVDLLQRLLGGER